MCLSDRGANRELRITYDKGLRLDQLGVGISLCRTSYIYLLRWKKDPKLCENGYGAQGWTGDNDKLNCVGRLTACEWD